MYRQMFGNQKLKNGRHGCYELFLEFEMGLEGSAAVALLVGIKYDPCGCL